MIYGRRFQKERRSGPRTKRIEAHKYRSLQNRYSLLFLVSAFLGIILFLAPAAFFTIENYSIFKKLAFASNPQLIGHLERELVWLGFFITFAAVTVLTTTVFVSRRLLAHLTTPLLDLERHMKKVAKGDLSSGEFRHSETLDFLEIVAAYSFLYRHLRTQNETELKVLEKLIIDPYHRSSFSNWKALIEAKRNQLGIRSHENTPDQSADHNVGLLADQASTNGAPAESTSSAQDPRRAS